MTRTTTRTARHPSTLLPALIAAVALLMLVGAPSASAAAPATAPCHSIGDGKHQCDFYPAGDGLSAGAPVQAADGSRVGFLNHGANWVICQSQGASVTSGKLTNHWWAWTTANDQRTGWVNALYASGGANDGQFEGVPACAGAHGNPPGATAPAAGPPPTPPPAAWPHVPGAVNAVAMGDSYTSGVSLDDQIPGGCSRSRLAYPFELQLTGENVLTNMVACSGDKASSITGGAHGQLAALSDATDLVTLSAGGDDLDFSGVLKQCLESSCDNRVKQIDATLTATLTGKLNALYSSISSRLRPDAKVVVMGYPHLFPDQPDSEGFKCRNGILPRIRANEQKLMNTVADHLSTLVDKVATAHGLIFVDAVPIFRGHDVCSDDRYLNAIIARHPTQSFHPTAAGHRAEAAAISGVLG